MEKLISEFKRKMYLEGKSKRTIEVYGNSVREFFKWFNDSYGDVEFKKLYRENILEYKSYLKNIKKSAHSGNNLCPKSINSKLSALICFNELIEPDNIVVSKKDLIKIQSEMVSPTFLNLHHMILDILLATYFYKKVEILRLLHWFYTIKISQLPYITIAIRMMFSL